MEKHGATASGGKSFPFLQDADYGKFLKQVGTVGSLTKIASMIDACWVPYLMPPSLPQEALRYIIYLAFECDKRRSAVLAVVSSEFFLGELAHD